MSETDLTDVIPSVYSLGLDIIVTSKLKTLQGLVGRAKKGNERCDWSENFFDIVVTDVIGAHQLKEHDEDFYSEVKCNLRVLDRHGTDPWFNDETIVTKSGYKNPLGELGLPNTRQYLTLYPQMFENDWIGFISYPSEEDDFDEADGVEKLLIQVRDRARNKNTLIGNEEMLNKLSKEYQLHFTIADTDFKHTQYRKAENHGHLEHRDYLKLMRSVNAVVGLGYPYEDRTGVEAISQGAFYINPKFPKPKSRLSFIKNGLASLGGAALPQFASNYFQNLTTFRPLSSQNPFVETFNTSNQATVDANEVMSVLKTAERQKPSVLDGFEAIDMMKRLQRTLLDRNYCLKSVRFPWVKDNFVPFVGKPGEDCYRVCEKKTMYCNPEHLPRINTRAWLAGFLPNCEKFLGIKSLKYWTLGYPAVNDDTCIYQSKQALLSCDGRPEGENRRICPCQKSPFN